MELPKNLSLDKTQKWEITHFDEITNFLWANRKNIIKQGWFDSPDYGGLPKRLSNRLSSDLVDAIQSAVSYLIDTDRYLKSKMTKKEFCNKCASYLFTV